MDPKRWQRIEGLYHSALERSANQRSKFLAEACEGDDELRREVELILAQSDSTENLVGRPVWEVVAGAAETSGGLTPGTRLGPYIPPCLPGRRAPRWYKTTGNRASRARCS